MSRKAMLPVVLTLCYFLLSITVFGEGIGIMSAPGISNDGSEIRINWSAPSWDGATVDKYEIQIAKTDASGKSQSIIRTITQDASDGTTAEYSASTKGYYKARVRGKDVNNKYSDWSPYSDKVSVTSEDVGDSGSGSGAPYVGSRYSGGGPGIKTEPAPSASDYVPSGPGAQGAAAESYNISTTGSSGAGHGWSSQTMTSGRVMVNTYVSTGWQSDRLGRWYLYEDGSYPISSWRNIDGSFYHFNEKGYMDWNRWIREPNGDWHFCVSNGTMATGWNNINEKWYYMNPANGVMYTQGEYIIDGKYYYIDANGIRLQDAWISGHYYGSDGARTD